MHYIYFYYITLLFFIIQFSVALVNYLTKPAIKPVNKKHNELVSILIPARNEEQNLPILLDSLINEDYENLEIIVLNDHSTDKTEEILKSYSERYGHIRYINGQELKTGWLGKNWACYQLSLEARGQYYLFLDADTVIKTGLINSVLSYLKINDLKLLSIFPTQLMITLGEKLTVPLMNNILLGLLPLIAIKNTKYHSLAAANGQFMLFEAENYKSNQWHEIVKKEITEDIKIIRLIKKSDYKAMTLLGNNLIECRMYKNINEAINGFSKNLILMLGGSVAFLFIYLFFMSWVWIYLFYQANILSLISIILFIVVQRVLISIISNQNIFSNLVLYPLQVITLNVIAFVAIYKRIKGDLVWKDRKIN